jgi:hypothetical protein
MKRLECSIRTKQFLVNNGLEENKDDNYIPSLYIPTSRKPPDASKQTELAMSQFSSALEKEIENNKTKPNQPLILPNSITTA